VTKAAPGWYSDGTNKAYWDGNVVSQFQACSVLSIVLNSFTGGCLYFTLLQDLLKLQHRLVLITALHGQTIQDLLLALDVIYLHLLLLLDLECKV
jgi:hypothetical protein